MSRHGTLVGAVLCFAIGTAAFWLGRFELATSIPLMLFVSFWMLMALLLALRADTTGALEAIARNVPLLSALRKPKGDAQGGAP